MLRKVAQFYLLAMILVFAITLIVGSGPAAENHVQIVMLALLAWPLSALILLARSKVQRLRETVSYERTANR